MTKSGELSFPRWLLPAELADTDGTRRRTVRDWLVDTGLFAVAVFVGLWQLGQPETRADLTSETTLLLDLAVGAASCLLLWWRRRIPLILVWLMLPAQLAWSASGAIFVAILTAAIHRPWRPVVCAVGAHVLLVIPSVWYFELGDPVELMLVAAALYHLLPMLWGMTMRGRRQLVLSLRREQRQLTDAARQAERRRIAREMHDSLAHRLSLVSVHAGALAFRTGTDPHRLDAAEVQAATRIIQDSAQRAVLELGEVLTLLRVEDGEETAPPAAEGSLRAQIETLAAESRTAGQTVDLAFDGAGMLDDLSVRAHRTVQRVVQEGLTNARKHAPGFPVTVRLKATGRDITVDLTNPLPETDSGTGFGLGLTGLHERVSVDGGSLEHETRHGRFRLTARIPWKP